MNASPGQITLAALPQRGAAVRRRHLRRGVQGARRRTPPRRRRRAYASPRTATTRRHGLSGGKDGVEGRSCGVDPASARQQVSEQRQPVGPAGERALRVEVADALARESVAIAKATQAAEDHDRRRRALLDILSLVNGIFFKANQVNNPGRWRCKEQLDLNSHLIDIGVDLQWCRKLAGAGQGSEALSSDVQARNEVEAELRKLASDM